MAEVECSGTDLEEQRRHYEKIVPAHENDLDILPAFAKPLQMTGRANSTEAAAEDHDSARHVISQRSQRLAVRDQKSEVETRPLTPRPRPRHTPASTA